MPKNRFDYDTTIIGGGPGGLVSALYLSRFRRKNAIVNAGSPRISWGPRIKNLIGYEHGISGKILLKRLVHQIESFGKTDFIAGEAHVRRLRKGFEIVVNGNASIRAKTVILATGISDLQPEIPNLKTLRRLALLKYCSICDGYEIRDKPIAVLAQDDYGIQKALFLAAWTRDIRIVVPEDFHPGSRRIHEIREVRAKLIQGKLERMTPSEDGNTLEIHVKKKKPFSCSVAYVELGCQVNDSAFKHLHGLRRSKEGFLITTQEGRTSIPGLFAVGDCVNLLGQVSVAAGQAAVAATTIHNDLLDWK